MTHLATIETILRVLVILVYVALAVWMLPGAWAASRVGLTRRGDPMRQGTLLVALVFVGFNLNTLLNGRDQGVIIGLLILTLMAGVQIARLAKAYGRGPRI